MQHGVIQIFPRDGQVALRLFELGFGVDHGGLGALHIHLSLFIGGFVGFEFGLAGRLGMPQRQETFVVQNRLAFGNLGALQHEPGALQLRLLDLDLILADRHLILQDLPVDAEQHIPFFPAVALIHFQQLQRAADFGGNRRIFDRPDGALHRNLPPENALLQWFERHAHLALRDRFGFFFSTAAGEAQYDSCQYRTGQ